MWDTRSLLSGYIGSLDCHHPSFPRHFLVVTHYGNLSLKIFKWVYFSASITLNMGHGSLQTIVEWKYLKWNLSNAEFIFQQLTFILNKKWWETVKVTDSSHKDLHFISRWCEDHDIFLVWVTQIVFYHCRVWLSDAKVPRTEVIIFCCFVWKKYDVIIASIIRFWSTGLFYIAMIYMEPEPTPHSPYLRQDQTLHPWTLLDQN